MLFQVLLAKVYIFIISYFIVCLVFFLQALGSFYFLHESLKNIYQFDFKGKQRN